MADTTPKTRKPRAPRASKSQETEVSAQLYIRNSGLVRVRIAPPRKRGDEYAYNLAPRGERGDSEPVDDQDLNYFTQGNENQGLYELISEEDAMKYMVKQTRNQQRFHPALAALTDEKGNPIRGIAHEGAPKQTVISQVVVPEGNLNEQ